MLSGNNKAWPEMVRFSSGFRMVLSKFKLKEIHLSIKAMQDPEEL